MMFGKSIKKMSMRTTPRQEKFAKFTKNVVTKFVDTKPKKYRK